MCSIHAWGDFRAECTSAYYAANTVRVHLQGTRKTVFTTYKESRPYFVSYIITVQLISLVTIVLINKLGPCVTLPYLRAHAHTFV